MPVSLDKLVSWYTSRLGTGTYNMEGSRDFSDGTADCSGSATEALYEAGASRPAYLYSTVSLPVYLIANGFERIAQNQDWDMKAGDIILWSDGISMADSGGAGGHVMVAVDGKNEISTDYSREGDPAVNEYDYNQYYSWNHPNYVEVWRLGGNSQSVNKIINLISKGIKDMKFISISSNGDYYGKKYPTGSIFWVSSDRKFGHVNNPSSLSVLQKVFGNDSVGLTAGEFLDVIQELGLQLDPELSDKK